MMRFPGSIARRACRAVVALVPLIAACNDESENPIGPDGDVPAVGMGTAVVHDSAAVLPVGRDTPMPEDSMLYEGTVTGSAEVEILSDSDGWTTLGSVTNVSFEIFCEEAVIVGAQVEVPTGTYSSARLILTGFQADVDAGAVIGGVTYDEGFSVTFGSGDPVAIERDVGPVSVSEGTVVTLIFDLNTESWMDAEVVSSGTISADEIEAATNVIVR